MMEMDSKNNTTIKTELSVSLCTGCGQVILDRFILEVSGLPWHSKCLKCSACQVSLESEPCCYLRDSQVYCRTDYQRVFGTKCSKCNRIISPKDWVRRAREQVYHLACFACDGCKRQLSTGEEFALADDKVLCKLHFQEIFEGSSNEDSCGDGESSSSSSKSKTKRVRTTFSDEQLAVLQANFQLDSNPDGQDLERIAQITGLSKRVTQVWFQNSRARQKKHMAKQKKGGYLLHHHPHHGSSSFEKTTSSAVVSSQLSDSDSTSGASPLTMLYSFT